MRQIIALGGGGFSQEPENPLLDTYILNQSNKPNPNICFLPTASGDAEGYITCFYRFFENLHCNPSHLSLSKPPTCDLEGFLLEKDIIYVGGGDTKHLLTIWVEWGLNKILKKAWNQGTILAGMSAGSVCWFEEGITDVSVREYEPIKALDFISGSHCPHYDCENWKPSFHQMIASGKLKDGIAADEGVAIHYVDQDIKKIVSSRPNAKANWVTFEEKIVEKELKTEFLGTVKGYIKMSK